MADGGEPRPPDREKGDQESVHWERVKDLFADALDLPVANRAEFLERTCDGDEPLRREVESLLAKSGEGTGFLEVPATSIFDVPAPKIGSDVGGYTLRAMIGEGGMGRVFEATQEHPHRTVALKVLRPGFLAPDAERRFHWEVEALGRLSHPAIAAVHDAGVDEGPDGHAVSWFAMEKVDGQPMLVAADALGLDRRQRLELFLEVADAIAHAHQRGIIHRDLKPDNILVDADGRPHVLDFGIARAADPLASSVTTKGEILGTIAYMSPEQVLGEPDKVDARSDVYALGVLLYRLLTGAPPLELDGLSLPQVALRLSQDDPRPARDCDTSLRGDLDTILSMALERDVHRRYPTVDALAADVRRTLRDEPITARPPTTWYQLSKFARRHRGLVAGTSAALLALLVGLIGTTIGFVRAADARDRANEETLRAEVARDRAHDANRFLRNMFASARPDIVGRDVRVADLLKVAAEELRDRDAMEAAVGASLNLTIGDTYRRLGMQPEARALLEVAVESFTLSDGPTSDGAIEAQGALVEVLLDLGEIERADEVLASMKSAVSQRTDRIASGGAAMPEWMSIRPLELDGARATTTGDLAVQLACTREVFGAWSRMHPAGHDAVETARTLLSNALLANGEYAETDVLLAEGIAALTELHGPDHDAVLTQRANQMLATLELGERTRAIELAEAMLPTAVRVWGRAHPKSLALNNNYASALESASRVTEALEIMQEQLAIVRESFGPHHEETITVRNNLAVMRMRDGDFERALEVLQENLVALDGARGEASPFLVLRTEMNLGPALEGLGRRPEALEVQRRVVGRFETLAGEGHPQTLVARNNLAMTLLKSGEAQEAVEVAARNLSIAEESQPGHRNNMFPFRSNLARALAGAGDPGEATRELLAVEQYLREDPEAAASEVARVRELLAETYEEAGQPAEARRWRE